MTRLRVEVTRPTPERWDHHLLIDLGERRECLSSAVLGGGLRRSRYIVNRSVPNGWNAADPVADMKTYLRGLGLEPNDCTGLLTSVPLSELQQCRVHRDAWQVEAFVTAGVGNAAAAGTNIYTGNTPGTINLILVVWGCLSPAALVGAVQSATEAKTAALYAAGVTTAAGERATGTTTDTVTVVNAAPEPRSVYAGLATAPGYAVASSTYRALSAHFKETYASTANQP